MSNLRITYPGDDWGVDITREQLAVGVDAATTKGATHYRVWDALKNAGVPVRNGGGKLVASLAATIIQASPHMHKEWAKTVHDTETCTDV